MITILHWKDNSSLILDTTIIPSHTESSSAQITNPLSSSVRLLSK
jgi:hypothetical protein